MSRAGPANRGGLIARHTHPLSRTAVTALQPPRRSCDRQAPPSTVHSVRQLGRPATRRGLRIA
eukprot:3341315-Prymnesium_polylepis.1